MKLKKINRHERTWKIKTSEEKFKIIPLAQTKTKTLKINNKDIQTCNEGKFLGLKLQKRGITGHCVDIKNKGNAVLTKLKFTNLTPKLKATLVKTQLIPILEYPPVPITAVSNTQKKQMQTVLNKALRFIHQNEDTRLNSEELHIKYDINPLNISIHKKSKEHMGKC